MARLRTVLSEDDLRRRQSTTGGLDLAPYVEMLDAVLDQGGVGGLVDLDPEESARTVKGRLTRAASQRGKKLVWRSSAPGELRFVLADAGGPVPGARERRPRGEVQAEQTTIDAVMTEDVAAVTHTQAADESTEPETSTREPGAGVTPPAASRRRGRAAPR